MVGVAAARVVQKMRTGSPVDTGRLEGFSGQDSGRQQIRNMKGVSSTSMTMETKPVACSTILRQAGQNQST
jgi:hypothetical protein